MTNQLEAYTRQKLTNLLERLTKQIDQKQKAMDKYPEGLLNPAYERLQTEWIEMQAERNELKRVLGL